MSKAFEMISESLNEIIEDFEKNDGKNLHREVLTKEKLNYSVRQKKIISDVINYSEEKFSEYRQAAVK